MFANLDELYLPNVSFKSAGMPVPFIVRLLPIVPRSAFALIFPGRTVRLAEETVDIFSPSIIQLVVLSITNSTLFL